MSLRSCIVTWACSAAVAFVAGCVSFPTEDLRTFDAAFQQARLAGDALLDKVSPVIAEVEQSRGLRAPSADCGRDFTGTPRCFDLAAASGGAPEPRDIAVRRIALELVATYSQVLVDLAAGKSAAEVQSRVAAVADLANSALALLSIANPLAAALPALQGQFGAIVARFEQARANAVARQSILEARGAIQGILTALRQDAPTIYELYRTSRLRDRNIAASRGGTEDVRAITQDINEFYDSIVAYVALLDTTSRALDTLAGAAEAGGRLNIANLRATIREATEIRAQSITFWDAIRKVRG